MRWLAFWLALVAVTAFVFVGGHYSSPAPPAPAQPHSGGYTGIMLP